MTDEQFAGLTALLERIAVALEPRRNTRSLENETVPPGGGRRIRIEQLIEQKITDLVDEKAFKLKP